MDNQSDEAARSAERLVKVRLAACEGALSQLEQVFDSVADAICVVDVSGEVFKVNRRFLELLEHSKDEVVGQALSQVMASQGCDRNNPVLERIKSGAPVVERELVWSTGARAGRAFLMTAKPFAGPGGELVGAILSFRDVHDFKRLEKRLTEARKMESLGQLVEGLAHEINTPCQFLGSNLEFLEGACAELLQACRACASSGLDLDFLSEEVPSAVSQSRAGVERIAKIIRAMRGFAQAPTAEAVLSDISPIVEDAITLSTPKWEPHATIEFHADIDLPAVPVFASELSQAVLALITNAVEAIYRRAKASDQGKGHIDLQLVDADDHVELRVSDDGDGIDPKIASRVFDMFFTTKPVGEGLGQGLALVHTVVVGRHHGTVAHHPRPGGGTVFVLALPTL